MTAPDLRNGPPPRWSDAVEGIVWLPRLAAKTRAYAADTLGTYLLGQSPIDDEFLRAAHLRYREFIAIVRSAADDAEVLAAIEAAAPGARERLRLWSIEMPVRLAPFMRLLDFDDGYDRPAWLALPHAAAALLVPPLIALLRRIRPLRA
jgi:hypothetical protein